MRPARLCREMTTPIWFGRAPLHAAVISCCVLPVAKARTCSPRVGEVRLPPAGFAATVSGRPRGRAGAAACYSERPRFDLIADGFGALRCPAGDTEVVDTLLSAVGKDAPLFD